MERFIKEMAKVSRFVFWAPRILAILFLLFLSIFSFDVFDGCNSFLNCAGGLFVHNIPAIILLIMLVISWKHELVGAISFFIAGILYIASIFVFRAKTGFEWYHLLWIIQIAGPAFLIGALFLVGWKQKNKSGKRRY